MIAFSYTVIRKSNRKTASLSVSPDNKVAVIVPDSLKEKEIQNLIDKKSKWIRDKIRFNEQVKYPCKPKEYVSGEAIIYTGRHFRLKILEREFYLPARLSGNLLIVPVPKDSPISERIPKIKEAVTEWYNKVALSKFKSRVLYYEKHFDIKPKEIIVKNLKSRWGSCYKSGTVAFNWKVVMAPNRIIDYVVVHELCHLKHHDHSPKFWAYLESIIPDWRERKEWLRVNGGLLEV